MPYFNYQNNELYAEDVPLEAIAKKYGTPCYVYSKKALAENWLAFDNALKKVPHQICYAVKANSNLAILNLFAKLGSGFDIVSLGELERVLLAKGDSNKIVFSGVGKLESEIQRAVAANIFCFNVESEMELNRINHIANTMGKVQCISLRLNPNVDPMTHPHIATGLEENKFGIDFATALKTCERMHEYPNLQLKGLACHIGSQILSLKPFREALEYLLEFAHALENFSIKIEHLDIGGGLGISYQQEKAPSIDEYAQLLTDLMQDHPYKIIVEPGRAIIGNAGILLTRVEYLKETPTKNFAIVDAAMNDMMRPALYDSWQEILPVKSAHARTKNYDIVGPICESTDFLGKNRKLPLSANCLLAVKSAGAYGFSMSSNYNSRPRAAEVLVDGDKTFVICARETIEDLWRNETLLD